MGNCWTISVLVPETYLFSLIVLWLAFTVMFTGPSITVCFVCALLSRFSRLLGSTWKYTEQRVVFLIHTVWWDLSTTFLKVWGGLYRFPIKNCVLSDLSCALSSDIFEISRCIGGSLCVTKDVLVRLFEWPSRLSFLRGFNSISKSMTRVGCAWPHLYPVSRFPKGVLKLPPMFSYIGSAMIFKTNYGWLRTLIWWRRLQMFLSKKY